MSPAPERAPTGDGMRLPLPDPVPDRASALELRCQRCRKPIRDLQLEAYYLQTGLCFWCAYVDSQG